MKIELIKDGPYEGQYRSRGGIIFSKDEAKARYPDLFKPAVKDTIEKSAKPKRKR